MFRAPTPGDDASVGLTPCRALGWQRGCCRTDRDQKVSKHDNFICSFCFIGGRCAFEEADSMPLGLLWQAVVGRIASGLTVGNVGDPPDGSGLAR